MVRGLVEITYHVCEWRTEPKVPENGGPTKKKRQLGVVVTPRRSSEIVAWLSCPRFRKSDLSLEAYANGKHSWQLRGDKDLGTLRWETLAPLCSVCKYEKLKIPCFSRVIARRVNVKQRKGVLRG